MKIRQTVLFLLTVVSLQILALQPAAFGQTVHHDLAYKSTSGLSAYEQQRARLDLYLPENVRDFPVLLWFHGGGITGGDKREAMHVAIAQSLAARGVAVASVNYRLSPRATFPAYVEDAAASIAWIIDNIATYQGNPRAVFVSGHSAGAYLASMAGLDPQYLAAYGKTLADIRGVIPVSGQMVTHVTVLEERGMPSRPLVDAAAPVYHVGRQAPPFLAIAGSLDLPARAEENRYFAAAMQAAGHRHTEYLEFEGRDHGSIIGHIPSENDPVAAAMLGFIRQYSP